MITLTQKEADDLIEMAKWIETHELPVCIPNRGEFKEYNAFCEFRKNKFIVSLRRGNIALNKFTIQGRTSSSDILLRIDICQNRHSNPNGVTITGNHIHIYKEGFKDRYAEKFDPQTDSLTEICKIFFDKFCIINAEVYEQISMEV